MARGGAGGRKGAQVCRVGRRCSRGQQITHGCRTSGEKKEGSEPGEVNRLSTAAGHSRSHASLLLLQSHTFHCQPCPNSQSKKANSQRVRSPFFPSSSPSSSRSLRSPLHSPLRPAGRRRSTRRRRARSPGRQGPRRRTEGKDEQRPHRQEQAQEGQRGQGRYSGRGRRGGGRRGRADGDGEAGGAEEEGDAAVQEGGKGASRRRRCVQSAFLQREEHL